MHILSDEQYNRLMAMKAYMEDPAPLPMSDPAMACVEAYEDAWDYPTPEQQKRYSGLLEDGGDA